MRRLGIALLLALALLTTACSSDEEPGPAADPAPSDTAGEPTAEEPAEATEEPSEPLRYSTKGRTGPEGADDGSYDDGAPHGLKR